MTPTTEVTKPLPPLSSPWSFKLPAYSKLESEETRLNEAVRAGETITVHTISEPPAFAAMFSRPNTAAGTSAAVAFAVTLPVSMLRPESLPKGISHCNHPSNKSRGSVGCVTFCVSDGRDTQL